MQLPYPQTAATQLGCALRPGLRSSCRSSPVAEVLLLAAAVALLMLWLRWVIAPDAHAPLQQWGSLITKPWRHGSELRGSTLVLVWLFGLYACARGLLAGLAEQTGTLVTQWFMIGAVALLLLFLFLAGTGRAGTQSDRSLAGLTRGYFVCGMLVVGIAPAPLAVFGESACGHDFHSRSCVARALPTALVAVTAVMMVGGQRVVRGHGAHAQSVDGRPTGCGSWLDIGRGRTVRC